MASRQAAWARKQVAAGNCGKCGKPRNLYATRCDLCAVKHRINVRKKNGNNAWKPGCRGNKPKILETRVDKADQAG